VRLADQHRDNFPCAVVGIDVAGGEEWFTKPNQVPIAPPSNINDAQVAVEEPDLHTSHVEALKRARELKLNITLHAGEDTNCANIAEAMFEHGASRIGHGYHLTEDKELMFKAITRGIHFEVRRLCVFASFKKNAFFFSMFCIFFYVLYHPFDVPSIENIDFLFMQSLLFFQIVKYTYLYSSAVQHPVMKPEAGVVLLQ
jgi:hypothetical protein